MKKKILVAIISMLTVTLAISLAKYTNVIESIYSLRSSNFYFTSDYLEETSVTYQIYTSSVDVLLYNYDKSNINNVTNKTITYDTNIKYYDSSDTLIDEDNTVDNNTWIDNTYGKESSFNIPAVTNASYAIITVVSTSPYSKTLTARFDFNDDEYPPVYSVLELRNGFTVEIMTGVNNLSNISISWPEDCGPDNTNPLASSWTTGAYQGTLPELNALTSYSLNFYCNLETTVVNEVTEEVLTSSNINVTLN